MYHPKMNPTLPLSALPLCTSLIPPSPKSHLRAPPAAIAAIPPVTMATAVAAMPIPMTPSGRPPNPMLE